MASVTMLCIASLLSLFAMANAKFPGVYTGGSWQSAHATFYGGSDASGTMGSVTTPTNTSAFSLLCFLQPLV